MNVAKDFETKFKIDDPYFTVKVRYEIVKLRFGINCGYLQLSKFVFIINILKPPT